MRLKLPSRDSLPSGAQDAGRGLAAVGIEVLRIGREMLAIPVQLWLAAAELVGAAVLAAWRAIWPLLVAAFELGRRALAWAEREVLPVHGLIAVALVAALALGASQFVDYRGISVGTPDYAGVDTVAPAPEVDRAEAGSAHGWVLLPVAILAAATVVVSALGRWRLARLLVPLGLAAVLVSLAIDAPKGLDEGAAAISYEGAAASLLEGFWVQLVSGCVLIFCGPLLAAQLRPEGAPASGRRSLGDRRLRSRPGDRAPDRWDQPVNDPATITRPTLISRIERLLPFACLFAAVILFASQLMTMFEFTPPGAEPLLDRSVIDHHGPALLILAVFSVLALGIAMMFASQPAAIAVAVAGVLSLLMFLLIDLPDAGQVGTLDDPRRSFFAAEAVPQAGFWLELVGALALAISGIALATLNPEQLSRLVPGQRGETSIEEDPALEPPYPNGAVGGENQAGQSTQAERRRERT